MKLSAPLLCVFWLACNSISLQASVEVQRSGADFIVSIGDQPFALFNGGNHHSRPCFREVRAADGTLLSRPISPAGGDHPHHTGVWIAIDQVNDVAFWHQPQSIKNLSVEILETGGKRASMRVRNQWLSPTGVVVLHEQTTIHIYENRLLAYDILFTAGENEVTFGDTEEGFFAFRMADSLREEETGHVVNSDNQTTAQGCWGKTSDWVDYHGRSDGKTFGVAIFDYPLNFRPARYHVRDYGLFSINPFGESDYTQGARPAAPVTIPPGDSLRLRYAMYFHAGDATEGRVAAVFKNWVARTTDEAADSNRLSEIRYRSSADGTVQPAMFYAPPTGDRVPLLVALHTWSGDYRQDYHLACALGCREKAWAYIHPNFRGPNRRPEATGSESVVQDIVDAVAYASRRTPIDPARIYLVGTSGGGYTALLMAGRRPELWAGVSAWVPIVDLERWYHENKAMGDKHWREVADSCGGPPGTGTEVDRQYRLRSPITWLAAAKDVNLDINAGIRDGHEGSVPVSHALRAFNAIVHASDRLTKAEIDYFVREARVPEQLHQEVVDASYGDKQPLFRRAAQHARITLFDGGHELIPQAALDWLEKQRRLSPPKVGSSSSR